MNNTLFIGNSFLIATLLLPRTNLLGQNESASVQVENAILKTVEATTLAAQLSGVLQELHVKEGDQVQAAQRLGRIKDDAVRLELEHFKLQIEMARKRQANNIDERLAEKSKAVAQIEYQRAQDANAKVPSTYPPNEIDRLRLVADRSQLELERAQFLREMAKYEVETAISEHKQAYERYKRHQILAPSEGVVVAVEKRPGEWVEPGAEILTIVQIDRLRVEGFVHVGQAITGLMGKPVEIVVDNLASSLNVTGVVTFVSPDVNPVNSQVRIFVDVDNADRKLRPGIRVAASIDVSR